MSDLRKNDLLTLTITDVNNLGCGVARAPDGRAVFVRGAVTGDTVDAKIIGVHASYLVARIEAVTSPSPYRAEGFCDAPGNCGGCVYRHLTYDYEKEIKRNYIRHAFRKAGLPDVSVDPVLSAGERGYRNKAQYPFARSHGHVVCGFYAVKSHTVAPAGNCALQPPVFGEIAAFVCRFADTHGLDVYDETTGRGLLRHLYLRVGVGTGEIMVCLVLNGKKLPADTGAAFADALTAAFPRVASVMLNHNEKNTNVVLGDTYTCLAGKPYIGDILCGKRFRIAPAAFYQVNHDGAELLYDLAAARVGEGSPSLLDLYCGIGTIGIRLSDRVSRLVGVEIVPDAVACAKINAEENGVANADFVCADAGDAESVLSAALIDGKLPDVVVLDPPRKGCSPAIIDCLAAHGAARIVYVSCDPDTLARDCARFSSFGYTVGNVTPVDMFPRTGHVESVVLLSKTNF